MEEGVWEGWRWDEDGWEVGKEEWMGVGWCRCIVGLTGGGGVLGLWLCLPSGLHGEGRRQV